MMQYIISGHNDAIYNFRAGDKDNTNPAVLQHLVLLKTSVQIGSSLENATFYVDISAHSPQMD